MAKIKTVSVSSEAWIFEDGSIMQREKETLTPNGSKMNGRWVYRDANKNMLDFDKYCNDLAERFSLELYNLST
jgi:hypothetical protein